MLKPFTPEGRFECGFDKAVKGKVCALTPVVRENCMGLGIAFANEPGYCPVPLHWCHGDRWDELQAHADELNKELFQLDGKAAALIVLSTMFTGHRNTAATDGETLLRPG